MFHVSFWGCNPIYVSTISSRYEAIGCLQRRLGQRDHGRAEAAQGVWPIVGGLVEP